MKLVSSLALAAALVVGGGAAAPAAAQDQNVKAVNGPANANQRKVDIGKEARKPLQDLFDAVRAKNNENFAALLAAAEAVAKSPDEKYFVAKLRLEHAINLGDRAAQAAAAKDVIASGAAQPAEAQELQTFLTRMAINSGDAGQAESYYAGLIAANPNYLDSIVNLARAKMDLKKDGEALDLLRRAITLARSKGEAAPEAWYRNALQIAYKQNNAALAAELARDVHQAYPTKENFKNLIAVSATEVAKDEQAYVDLLRLMQASGTLDNAGDYLRLAEHLEFERNWGEAKSVLEAAARAGKTSPRHAAVLSRVSAKVAEDKAALPGAEPKARSAADGKLAASLAAVYAGYGDYNKAAELYRLALQKGGVDANLVNTRIGIALAQAGQRAEAEAAFRAVSGPRTAVANLWLAWLAQRG